jgi:ATP/maltotriose-dependent transcriptional regulator MalT
VADALLGELLTQLPSNIHLLMSGRARPPVPLTRLELTGQCRVIDESDLSLTPLHLAQLTKQSGLDST